VVQIENREGKTTSKLAFQGFCGRNHLISKSDKQKQCGSVKHEASMVKI